MKKILFAMFACVVIPGCLVFAGNETNFPGGINLGNDTISIHNFKDEDDMASDAADAVASQQSIKAYIGNYSIAKPSPQINNSSLLWSTDDGGYIRCSRLVIQAKSETEIGYYVIKNDGSLLELGSFTIDGVLNIGPEGDAVNILADNFTCNASDASGISKMNTIAEHTADTGVTIDGVLIKDGFVDGVDVSAVDSALTSHLGNSSNPHSVTKTQVGLGNVANVDQTNAANISSGIMDGDRLPAMSTTKKGAVPATGTPSGKYLKDDGTFATPAGGGDVTGPASTTENKVPQWDSATKTLKDGMTLDTSSLHTADDTHLASSKLVSTSLSAKAIAPATTTENKLPQWDSAAKTLKDGLTLDTSISSPGLDTEVPTSKAVVDYVATIPKTAIIRLYDEMAGVTTRGTDVLKCYSANTEILYNNIGITLTGTDGSTDTEITFPAGNYIVSTSLEYWPAAICYCATILFPTEYVCGFEGITTGSPVRNVIAQGSKYFSYASSTSSKIYLLHEESTTGSSGISIVMQITKLP